MSPSMGSILVILLSDRSLPCEGDTFSFTCKGAVRETHMRLEGTGAPSWNKESGSTAMSRPDRSLPAPHHNSDEATEKKQGEKRRKERPILNGAVKIVLHSGGQHRLIEVRVETHKLVAAWRDFRRCDEGKQMRG